jgi:hypothetical protein
LTIAIAIVVLWLDRNQAWNDEPFLRPLHPPNGNVVKFEGVYAGNIVGDPPPVLGLGPLIISLIAGCLALSAIAAGPNGEWGEARPVRTPLGGAGRCLVVFSLAHLALLTLIWPVFDRYILVLLPGVMLAILPRRRGSLKRLHWWAGYLILVVNAVLSVAMMHDWLAWNEARWDLARRAVARGIDPTDLEGGFEWDGWHSASVFSPGQAQKSDTAATNHNQRPPAPGLVIPFNQALFPHVTGRYAISFNPVPGTIARDTQPYTFWLAHGKRQLWLLESVGFKDSD